MSVNNEVTVALAGNPNVGKSTVFNALTGMRQHTGNWTGKTVDLATGVAEYNGVNYKFIDIPGTYSLKPHSAEEEIADDYICYEGVKKVVSVCDATSLERNLYLALQIIETKRDTVVCINMLDEARKQKIVIDISLLAHELGVKVCATSARKGTGLDELISCISENSTQKPIRINYPPQIESALQFLVPVLKNELSGDVDERWLSLRLLEGDNKAERYCRDNMGDKYGELENAIENAEKFLSSHGVYREDVSEMIAASLYGLSRELCKKVIVHSSEKDNKGAKDKIFTKSIYAYPVMFVALCVVFYITITLANYPSQLLSTLFVRCEELLMMFADRIGLPQFFSGVFITGGFRVMGWVIAVMLPPMAIFFPCFSFLEDLGVLPRVAYVLDNTFEKAGTCGKQALTTCMGYGCNCVGIAGTRIIDSRRERLIAIITNSLTPCNGRFPAIIAVLGAFLVGGGGILSAVVLAAVIVGSLALTLACANILSRTILKGEPSHYILEIPPYRKPQMSKIIANSLIDKTLKIIIRAAVVAFPAGMVLWFVSNTFYGNQSFLFRINSFFDPVGRAIGMDGVTLSSFFLGIPANEIVLPIALMSYLQAGELASFENVSYIREILVANGWDIWRMACFVVFCVAHFPCAASLMSIYKETKSIKWTALSFIIPLCVGVILCSFITLIKVLL